MASFKYIFGIDIAKNNFAIASSFPEHYYIFDFQNKINIIKKLKQVVDNYIIQNNPVDQIFVKIENQLPLNTTCYTIQHIFETILFMSEIKYQRINAESKYKIIKNLYGIDKIIKRDLVNYIQIDKTLCTKYIVNEKLEFKQTTLIRKYDDVIDAKIIRDMS